MRPKVGRSADQLIGQKPPLVQQPVQRFRECWTASRSRGAWALTPRGRSSPLASPLAAVLMKGRCRIARRSTAPARTLCHG